MVLMRPRNQLATRVQSPQQQHEHQKDDPSCLLGGMSGLSVPGVVPSVPFSFLQETHAQLLKEMNASILIAFFIEDRFASEN